MEIVKRVLNQWFGVWVIKRGEKGEKGGSLGVWNQRGGKQ